MGRILYCSLKSCKSKTSDGILIFHMSKSPAVRKQWQSFFKEHGTPNVEEFKKLKLCQFHFNAGDIDEARDPPRLKCGSYPVHKDIRVSTSC